MTDVVLTAAAWTAYLAAARGLQARATAFVGLLPASGTLELYAGASLLRTVTVGAWSVGTQRVDGRWPLTPGSITDGATGTGIPDLAVFKNNLGVEVCRMSAGIGSGTLQILSSLVAGEPLTAGSFALSYVAAPPDNPAPPTGKRWFPGHYLFAGEDLVYSGIDETRRGLVKTNDNWAGYQVIYLWRNHETSKGVYDFSLILSDLDKAQADGKALIVRSMERRFTSSRPVPVPQYIIDDYDGTWGDGTKIYMKTWDTDVAERYFLYLEAMFAACGSHPAFQGVFNEESSMGGEGYRITDQPGYTLAGEANYWRELSRRASAASGDAIFWMNMNYGYSSAASPSRYELMQSFVQTHKSGVGASDARMPGDLNGAATDYPFNPWQWSPATAIIAGVEYNTFTTDASRPTRTARDYLDFGVDTLNLTHMGWMARTDTSGVDFNIYDVITEIDRQSGRINTARPTNFPAG